MMKLLIFFFCCFAPRLFSDDSTMLSADPIQVLPETTLVDTEAQENAFQEDMDALFKTDSGNIDTTGWCTDKINAVKFDYKSMTDTIRFALVDSLNGRFFVFPFKNYVTSPFGPRRLFWHFGQDIKVRKGDTIRCAFDGIVRVIQNDRYGYGKVVVVRHDHRLETLYGHLSKSPLVINQKLKAGDVIGLGGNTGRSTGSHLHFEVRYGGEPFDPNHMVDFQTFALKADTLVLSKVNFDYLTEVRQTVFHTIRKGETLGHIARRYGTTVRKLCALNGISPRTLLKIRRKLIIRKETPPV